jgi:hypothetical protein
MLTGKPQAAMVHVGVNTANGLGALMAARKARVPILFSAGRTPLPKPATRLPEALRFELPTFYPDPQKLIDAVNLLIGAESPLS